MLTSDKKSNRTIFITGATGTIGRQSASRLARAGYRVYGLVRSPEKAAELEREGIHPVVGNLWNPDSYLDAAQESSVFIHAALAPPEERAEVDRLTINTLARLRRRAAHPPTMIYTSGVWVYGNTGIQPVSESGPLSPPTYVAWRPGIENLVLEAGGVVVRPGCVYGGSGGLMDTWIQSARAGKSPQVVGPGTNMWATVHLDDLADAYRRIIESGISGEILNIVDESRTTVNQLVAGILRAAGTSPDVHHRPLEEAVRLLGPVAECLGLDQRVDSSRAMKLLGWKPVHKGFLEFVLGNADILPESPVLS